MNCYLHPETPAVAFCRTCGRALCAVCQRPAEGTVFCQDHVPVPVSSTAPGAQSGNPAPDSAANPYFAPPPGPAPVRTSPALAFLLGFIPGVGAIYNGQYLKGLVHALICGLLITIVSNSPGSTQPLIGILIAAFFFYMPFEAYHTARKREMGMTPEEWSSLLPGARYGGRAPIGPILLIGIGVLYLLNSLDLLNFRQIARYWPVLLILFGVYLLYARMTGSTPNSTAANDPIDARHFGARSGAASTDLMGTRNE